MSLQAKKEMYAGSYFSQGNVLITGLLYKIVFLSPRVPAFFYFKVVAIPVVSDSLVHKASFENEFWIDSFRTSRNRNIKFFESYKG